MPLDRRLLDKIRVATQIQKQAYQPPLPPSPPMDPSLMSVGAGAASPPGMAPGGMPGAGMPGAPGMMPGGAPPMDPSMMQGGMPMDPSMMGGGGMPPQAMDPVAAQLLGGAPGEAAPEGAKEEGKEKGGTKELEQRVSALEDIIGQLASALGIGLPGEEAGPPAGVPEQVPAAPPPGATAAMPPPGFGLMPDQAAMAPKMAAEVSPVVQELRRRLEASI